MTQAEVIAALKKHGEQTANELCEHTGIPTYTLYNNLSKLRRKHEIENVPIEGRSNKEPLYKYRLKEVVEEGRDDRVQRAEGFEGDWVKMNNTTARGRVGGN